MPARALGAPDESPGAAVGDHGDDRDAAQNSPNPVLNQAALAGRIEAEHAVTDLDALAERIRSRLQRHVGDMVAIGADLIAAKEQLGHGNFGPWIEREFRLTARSAQLYMRAAEWAEGKSEIISHLPPHAIRLLSAPTTPAPIQEEVVEAIRAGAEIDFQEVGERIRHERATMLEVRQKEERKQARLRGKSPEYQKRLERQLAHEEADRERRARDRERRVEEARSILRRLPTADLSRLREIVATDRWLHLSELVDGPELESAVAPEPVEEAVAPPVEEVARPAAPIVDDEVDDLRAWAGTIDVDQLAKLVIKVPGYKNLADPGEKIRRFLDGRQASYHLRDALQAVRDDLAGAAP